MVAKNVLVDILSQSWQFLQLVLTAHLKPSTPHPIPEPSLPSVSQKCFLNLLLAGLCCGGTNFVPLFPPLVYLCFRREKKVQE